MVLVSAIQPVLALVGMLGLYVFLCTCFQNTSSKSGRRLHAVSRVVYWLGCVAGVGLFIYQVRCSPASPMVIGSGHRFWLTPGNHHRKWCVVQFD